MNFGQLLKTLEDARKNAAQGKFLNAYPNAGELFPMLDHVWTDKKELICRDISEQDGLFFALSANHIQRLIDYARKLKEQVDLCITFQEKAKNFISHYEDCNALVNEESEGPCECGMETFAHDNYIAISMAKNILAELDREER